MSESLFRLFQMILSPANTMEPVTTIEDDRDADGGFRKRYGPKSTDSLTFSIARIMEPDVRHRHQPVASAPTVDYYHALESAFKKYVPQLRSSSEQHSDDTSAVQLFHYRHQARLSCGVTDGPRPRPSVPLPVQPVPVPPLARTQRPSPHHSLLPRPFVKTVVAAKSANAARPSSSKDRSQPTTSTATAAASSVKTFTCNHCGKVFFAHYNLTRHMPVHTGARPFICKVMEIIIFCNNTKILRLTYREYEV